MILKTDRLSLRPLEMADASALFAILGDGEAMRHWHRPPLPRLATVEALLADELAAMASGGFLYWTVLRDGDGIGGIDLSHIAGATAQTGFLFRRNQWGQGLAREAMGAVIGHAFGTLGLETLSALVAPGNARAQRLLTALAFQKDGAARFVLRQSAIKNGA